MNNSGGRPTLGLWVVDYSNLSDEAAHALQTLYRDGQSRSLGVPVNDETVADFENALSMARCVDRFHGEHLPAVEQVCQLRVACRRLGVTPKVVEVLDVLTAGSDIEWLLTDEELVIMHPPVVWALDTYGSAEQQLLDCVTLGCLTRPPVEDAGLPQ